ncbi:MULTISPECIES: hypothetical protein [Paenibacillus]|uniref:Uncharacterized protein n=1 Tax=Paenibacillus naphthalenovorans TaxID=162209 RepID=A0A0U2W2C4_9BACL|nr:MULTISPECIES: hypothetical protein [Paenibacillus]ALS20670.1 hypothetical protein IJ22_02810 [Paenibacillus naphthalenovorans]NTZ17907.1 hypothetical protein [Paenibacillus sp. JMULE4]GCL70701.1 hypothetical protein PN4B1_06030 [Paenibacillus naphthalenovorans]SDI25675.1 hypothetical protein SAMN05421868_104239 [Paenibacillus naphthalenovorans]
MDFISTFLAERWFVILGALIVLFIVVAVVKTVVKWVIVLALLAGLFFYGASYKDQLLELGSTMGAKVAEEAKAQAMKVITEEAKDAKYTQNPDGSYTVATKSVRLDGKLGENSVQVTFMNQTFTLKLDDLTKGLIEQAKKNAGL